PSPPARLRLQPPTRPRLPPERGNRAPPQGSLPPSSTPLKRMSRELRPLLTLAGPVILAEIGWMSMGIVDTIMVGPLGPAAIGAAGLSASLLFAIAVFGMGLMLGLDTLVSQSYGARRLDECVSWLHHGVVLSVALTLPLMLLGWTAIATMSAWGLNDEIRHLAEPYMRVLLLGVLPLLLYASARRY